MVKQFSNEEKLLLHIDLESLKFSTTIVKREIDQSVSPAELKKELLVCANQNNTR
jgi:hypothetical protein